MERIFTLLVIIATVYGEAPAPYPESGWKPQGQAFTLPSRQISQEYVSPPRQISQEYGAPHQPQGPYPASGWRPQGQQFTLPLRQVAQEYGAPNQQVAQEYGAPSRQTAQEYNAPNKQVAQEYGAPNRQVEQKFGAQNRQVAQEYGAPSRQLAQEYGAPSRQVAQEYGAPSRQVAQEYGAPSRQIAQEYNAPNKHVAQEFGVPSRQLAQEYGAPSREVAQEYGAPNRQVAQEYGAPAAGSSQVPTTQYLPSQEAPRNFAGNDFGVNQQQPNYNTPVQGNNQQPRTQNVPNQYSPNPNNQYTPQPSSSDNQQNVQQQQYDAILGNRQNPFDGRQYSNGFNTNAQGNLRLDGQNSNEFGRFSQVQNPNQFDNERNSFVRQNENVRGAATAPKQFNQEQNVNQTPLKNNEPQQQYDSDEDLLDEVSENPQFSEQSENFDEKYNTAPARAYGAAATTTKRPTKARPRQPERDTPKPETTTEDSDEENSDQPSIAVSTAVATGQYYILQPDGRLQRVIYMTSQNPEDIKDNAYTANLMYENIQPIQGPIYSYNETPFVRIN